MMRSVYIETTIVSYLVARPSRDGVVAGHQQLTRAWWRDRRASFALFVSQAVLQEAAAGDATASVRRLALIGGLRKLDVTDDALALAARLMREVRLPPKAALVRCTSA